MKALVLVVALLGGFSSAHAAPVVIDRPVVLLDDEAIWQSQVDDRMTGKDPKLRDALVEEMIDERLMLREAKRRMITVDQSDVMSALDEIKKENKLDDAGLDAALKAQGYTRARYLVELGNQILILRFKNQVMYMNITIQDAEVDAEGSKQGKKPPLSEDDKTAIRYLLRKQRGEQAVVKWLADQRKRVYLEKR